MSDTISKLKDLKELLDGGALRSLDLGGCGVGGDFAPALAQHLLRAAQEQPAGRGSRLRVLQLGGAAQGHARPNRLVGAGELMAALQRCCGELEVLGVSHCLRLGEENGLDVMARMRTIAPWMRVVMVTAHSAVDTAVDAMQAGAADYLVKPCSPDQLRMSAAKQLEARQMAARLETLEEEVRQTRVSGDDRQQRHGPYE